MRAALCLLVVAACDDAVLVGEDAGVVDAGVVDAGVEGEGDGDEGEGEGDDGEGEAVESEFLYPPGCVIEPLELPFECEDDADWCSPRDQPHASYDLAAIWSRREGENWIVEVRTWGRFPFQDGLTQSSPAPPSPYFNDLTVWWNDTAEPTDATPLDPMPFAVEEACSPTVVGVARYGDGWSRMVPVKGACTGGYSSESQCTADCDEVGNFLAFQNDCLQWRISADFTTWQVAFNVSPELGPPQLPYWAVVAYLEGACAEASPFVPSRGGRADVEFFPVDTLIGACP